MNRQFANAAAVSVAALLAVLVLATPASAARHTTNPRIRAAVANTAAAGTMPSVGIRATAKGVAKYHPTSLTVPGKWTNTNKPCSRRFASFKLKNKTSSDQTITYNGGDIGTVGAAGSLYICATPGLGTAVLGLESSSSTLTVDFS